MFFLMQYFCLFVQSQVEHLWFYVLFSSVHVWNRGVHLTKRGQVDYDSLTLGQLKRVEAGKD